MANCKPLGDQEYCRKGLCLQNVKMSSDFFHSYFFFQRLSANTGIRFKDLTKT